MFSDVVLLHGSDQARNVCSSEKMTQAGDGNIWPAVTCDMSTPGIVSTTNVTQQVGSFN